MKASPEIAQHIKNLENGIDLPPGRSAAPKARSEAPAARSGRAPADRLERRRPAQETNREGQEEMMPDNHPILNRMKRDEARGDSLMMALALMICLLVALAAGCVPVPPGNVPPASSVCYQPLSVSYGKVVCYGAYAQRDGYLTLLNCTLESPVTGLVGIGNVDYATDVIVIQCPQASSAPVR